MLYGDEDGKQLEETWQIPHQYDTLAAWTGEQWTAFLRRCVALRVLRSLPQELTPRSPTRYLVDAPTITITGKPSAALAKQIEKAEKARIKAQKAALGEAGLKAKDAELQRAKNFNDRDIPKDVLEEFGVPDVRPLHLAAPDSDPRALTPIVSARLAQVKSVTWIDVQTAVNDPLRPSTGDGPVQKHVNADGPATPFHTHFANTKVCARARLRGPPASRCPA